MDSTAFTSRPFNLFDMSGPKLIAIMAGFTVGSFALAGASFAAMCEIAKWVMRP